MKRTCMFAVALFATTLLVFASAANAGQIARYAFDEGSGSVLQDSVGGHDGTIYGASWDNTGGVSSLSFDGVDDWVNVPSTGLDAIEAAGTIEFWYWMAADAPQTRAFVAFKTAANNWTDFRLMVFLGNGTKIYGATADGANFSWASDGDRLTDQWAHVALTWDGSNSRIYHNGVQGAMVGVQYGPEISGLDMMVGRVNGLISGNYDYFQGKMTHLTLWDEALSASTIEAHYNAGVPLLPVPEPATISLLGIGLAGLIGLRRRRA